MTRTGLWLLTVSVLATFFVGACGSTSKQLVAEQPPPTYQPSPESTPVRLTVAAAPKLSEVQ
ncbi:MAG TPA: hypothetical protein VK274_02715, partial [Pyrinomonadaceae bacterium]|nr:hypothetical protein [Pyrinomonadaceae bacterium]